MATEVRVKTVILPGDKIEISTAELIPGRRATVVVTIEDDDPIEQPHVIDIPKTLAGHRLYQSAEEVDAYIREERDAWDIVKAQKADNSAPTEGWGSLI